MEQFIGGLGELAGLDIVAATRRASRPGGQHRLQTARVSDVASKSALSRRVVAALRRVCCRPGAERGLSEGTFAGPLRPGDR